MKDARILVVDDNPVNRTVLANLLSRQGYQVEQAAEGAEAVAKVRRIHPDLVLLDIVMPVMDGLCACEILRRDEKTRDIPVIMVSSLDLAETKMQCFAAGAVDYITKPFHSGEVLARIRTHLKIVTLTRTLRAKNRELKERQQVIEADLKAAAEIQRALLPASDLVLGSVRSTFLFQPCEQVGGDLFHAFSLDERFLAAYMVDVAGHGVTAAMLATQVAQALSPQGGVIMPRKRRGRVRRPRPPVEVLSYLDRQFPIERFNRSFTMVYLLLDQRTGRFSYTCAGHPPILQVTAKGRVLQHGKGGTMIGLGELAGEREEGQGTWEPGDRLFLVSDGLLERLNGEDLPAALAELADMAAALHDQPLEEVRNAVRYRVDKGMSRCRMCDDISLLVIEGDGA